MGSRSKFSAVKRVSNVSSKILKILAARMEFLQEMLHTDSCSLFMSVHGCTDLCRMVVYGPHGVAVCLLLAEI